MSKPYDDFHSQICQQMCIDNKTFLNISGDLQGEPGPRGQKGPKGTKGDQVRISKHKHFSLFAVSSHKGANMCMFGDFQFHWLSGFYIWVHHEWPIIQEDQQRIHFC